ncbi:MAG: lipid A export permease/ATP-binding protein MsbA [Deltaproteobacteria bacterium]|nr:MAG: lipid A export permease/ATP-binding protein MsbA [Deltaproteobacteria bacterium]RLB76761.1 MAG: lipid A export permease/ATP-binding protein MsbA [Deltaproteobacteria bacterium]
MSKSKQQKNIYLRLVSYAIPYRWVIALSMVASLGVAASDASIAYLVKPFVDDLIVAGNVDLAKLVPFLVVGLATFKGLSRYIQSYNIRKAGQLAIQDIRNEVFGHSLRLPMSFFSSSSSGSLISRILNDVNVMQSALADVLVTLLRESLTLVALTGYAFYADWKMALMAFVIIPATIWPAAAIGRKIKKFSRRGQDVMGTLTGVLEQSFSGIKVIKAFATEEREEQKFIRENYGFFTFIRKTFRYSAASAPVMEIMTSFGVAAVLWYGLGRVADEAMTKGELFSILAAILLMYSPLKRLIKVNNTMQKAVGAAERVFEVLDSQIETGDVQGAVELTRSSGHVSFENVGFAYDDELVLRNFSVQAKPGEVIALVGASGAGKSTFIGLLNRFYDPQQGQILIDGCDIRNLTRKSLHANLALVDQETFLFNDTIANNIRYGQPDADLSQIEVAAKQAYADEFIHQLPDGYETSIGDRGVRLSGGQRQRLCIARAILCDAPILMLDEATSALDTESEAMVQQALGNLMKNRTTFVIAHRLSTIMHADRILVLDGGEIKESGTHQQLLEKSGLYKRFYETQFRE